MIAAQRSRIGSTFVTAAAPRCTTTASTMPPKVNKIIEASFQAKKIAATMASRALARHRNSLRELPMPAFLLIATTAVETRCDGRVDKAIAGGATHGARGVRTVDQSKNQVILYRRQMQPILPLSTAPHDALSSCRLKVWLSS